MMGRCFVARMKFRIEKGMHIVVEGSVSVYTLRGEYQFQTVKIEPYGQGALALAFEQLKEKLKNKGYFDKQHKKPIPKEIHHLVLVTAKESAALHDMLKIIEKRWPLVEVTVVDTLVQGEQAGRSIASALKYADTLGTDVVIVGRGGGSTEDLWAFNEEVVADAIFAMHTPVVSAVGHEVDVLISDYVADLRAPTPSAAIEMVLPDKNELLYHLDETAEGFVRAFEGQLLRKMQQLYHIESLLRQQAPTRKLQEIEQAFGRMQEEYRRTLHYKFGQYMMQIQPLKIRFEQSMAMLLRQKEQQAAYLHEKMKLSDPRLQCKEGWAQVSYNSKPVSLSQIEPQMTFVLEDASIKLEAVCLSKKEI